MTIGERLKAWRIQNKLTLPEIKEKTGISTGGFSDYEHDKKLIGGKPLIALYNAFHIDIQYILTGEKTKFDLNENDTELLNLFHKLPEREQIKYIARLEDAIEKYELTLSGKSSESMIS